MRGDVGSDSELLICIGAQKAGTSSLHAWLGSLAEVATSRDGKEIDYFSRYFDFGTGWYLSHFSPSKPVWLDVSPNYLIVPDLLERLRSLPLRPRILLIVRDPVQRARSQHRHALVTRPATTARSFRTELAGNPTYVRNGLYGRTLQGLAPLLEEDRLRVVWFDELSSDPAAVLGPLCADLGLSSRPSPALLERRSNTSAHARSKVVGSLTRVSGRALRHLGGERAVARFRASGVIDRLLSANRRELAPGVEGDGFDMDPEELRSLFAEDLRLAERLTGLPFIERFAQPGHAGSRTDGGEQR